MDNHQLQYNKLTSLIQTWDEKVHSSATRAAQLAAADLIIQGIVYNSAAALQDKWWVPICLSASVTVAFSVTFAAAVRVWLENKRERDAVLMEWEDVDLKMAYIRSGHQVGTYSLSTADISAALHRRRRAMEYKYGRYIRYAYTGVVCIALHLVNMFVLYALSNLSISQKN